MVEMESLAMAMTRLREAGFVADMSARADGSLRCSVCGATCALTRESVTHVVRFEGQSDPGDEAILIALRGPCGHQGLFSSPYGVGVPAESAKVLRRLSDLSIE